LFKVGTVNTSPTPDFVINSVPGLRAEAYLNCQNTTQQLSKVMIYVEGYELMDFLKIFPFYKNDKLAIDYDEMLKKPQVIQLQNFGYDIVMVDFGSTGKSIQDNAMSQELIFHWHYNIFIELDLMPCLVNRQSSVSLRRSLTSCSIVKGSKRC